MAIEVLVFTLKGNELTVLDMDRKCKYVIDVSNYIKAEVKKLIGEKILIEEDPETGAYDFAGISALNKILNAV